MEVARTKFKMKEGIFASFFVSVLLVLFLATPVYSQSNYVLPYPGAMPGSSFYKLHLLLEKVNQFWYFGDFGQFEYNLKESDKYLVEAKTLFEYKQYLLGYKALEKSNNYFAKIKPNLNNAKQNNKDISQKEAIFKEASLKHLEVLSSMLSLVPERFVWSPEKSPSSILNLKDLINQSIKLRKSS